MMKMLRLVSAVFMLLVAFNTFATEKTADGRAFESLSPSDVEALSEAEKTAYQGWQTTRDVEQTSTYQQSEGPNTMDISSDFSM